MLNFKFVYSIYVAKCFYLTINVYYFDFYQDKDRSKRSKMERRDRSGQVTYQSSRWIPVITDVMQVRLTQS